MRVYITTIAFIRGVTNKWKKTNNNEPLVGNEWGKTLLLKWIRQKYEYRSVFMLPVDICRLRFCDDPTKSFKQLCERHARNEHSKYESTDDRDMGKFLILGAG